MKKIALALAAVAAMILGLGGVANANPIPIPNVYPPVVPSVTVTPSTVGPGGTVTVTANCTPGETVTVTLESATASAPCGEDGTVTLTISAPSAVGTYNGTVAGTVSGPLGSFAVTVLAAGPTPTTPTGGLPSTGSDGTNTTTMIAAGLLVVGLGLFAVATVRRRQTPAAL
jgi:LPXTG-motif cell wall-anchored protein